MFFSVLHIADDKGNPFIIFIFRRFKYAEQQKSNSKYAI